MTISPRWLEILYLEHQLKLLEEGAEDAAMAEAAGNCGGARR